ncbi:MAG: hypothetical protein JNM27_08670 [Leptospirales bacterium]|nr:hypothetical protein [Leptospirales bacterium]
MTQSVSIPIDTDYPQHGIGIDTLRLRKVGVLAIHERHSLDFNPRPPVNGIPLCSLGGNDVLSRSARYRSQLFSIVIYRGVGGLQAQITIPSLARLIYPVNTRVLNREEVKKAISRLSELVVGIGVSIDDLMDAEVSRIDLFRDQALDHPWQAYAGIAPVLAFPHTRFWRHENTCYWSNKQTSIAFYDKERQLKDSGTAVDTGNLARLEIRLLTHDKIIKTFGYTLTPLILAEFPKQVIESYSSTLRKFFDLSSKRKSKQLDLKAATSRGGQAALTDYLLYKGLESHAGHDADPVGSLGADLKSIGYRRQNAYKFKQRLRKIFREYKLAEEAQPGVMNADLVADIAMKFADISLVPVIRGQSLNLQSVRRKRTRRERRLAAFRSVLPFKPSGIPEDLGEPPLDRSEDGRALYLTPKGGWVHWVSTSTVQDLQSSLAGIIGVSATRLFDSFRVDEVALRWDRWSFESFKTWTRILLKGINYEIEHVDGDTSYRETVRYLWDYPELYAEWEHGPTGYLGDIMLMRDIFEYDHVPRVAWIMMKAVKASLLKRIASI